MKRPLAGRVALVTGGTRGIGAAIAKRLMADGATVTVTGKNPAAKAPKGMAFRAVDFADRRSAEAFMARVALMKVDILVNNAGINVVSPFAEINPRDFDRIQEVNARAPFLLSRAALPGMRKRGWGRIINITSLFGHISKSGRGAYSASKFALEGMTAALAAEVAADGVLANCVAPGFIDTDLTRGILGVNGMKELAARVPMKRFGKPEEIAALVVWLAGPENTYISGQSIVIDGGFSRI